MRRAAGRALWAVAALAAVGCSEGGATPARPPAPSVAVLRPVDAGARALGERLAPLVTGCWGVPVSVAAAVPLPGAPPPSDRRDARGLLQVLAAQRRPEVVAFVVLARAPLRETADPASRPVYGLGDGPGRTAVMSTHGLGEDADGAPWLGRRARVLLHETGHALGLGHCDDAWCLMHDCTGLAELDRCALAPCAICWRRFCAVRGQDPAVRRTALVTAAAVLGLTVDPPGAATRDQ